MRVSELIALLTSIQSKHGDLTVHHAIFEESGHDDEKNNCSCLSSNIISAKTDRLYLFDYNSVLDFNFVCSGSCVYAEGRAAPQTPAVDDLLNGDDEGN